MKTLLFSLLLIFTISNKNTTMVSYYAEPFHGRITANGEKYNMYALTAASPTLPFNTVVEITNLENNKKVKVRINDRGPYNCYIDSLSGKIRPYRPLQPHSKRGFDLSKAAFDSIADLSKGILNVKYKIITNERINRKSN